LGKEEKEVTVIRSDMQGKFISIYITEELRWHVLNTAFKGKVLQIPKAAVIMMAVILYL
jgi:hypothetical protein